MFQPENNNGGNGNKTISWRLTAATLGLTALAQIVFVTGCATTRTDQFESFAAASDAYTQTLNVLLTTSGKLAVDANSYKLIDGARLTDNKGKREDLQRANRAMREMLAALGQIKKQSRLLRNYFQALADLATSDAPAKAGKTKPGLLQEINGLSKNLKGTPLLNQPKAAKKLGAGTETLVVHAMQRRALERELKARKDVIAEVLLIHETLLEGLQARITHDLAVMNIIRTRSQIIDPFTTGKAAKTPTATRKWVKGRREILLAEVAAGGLTAAAEASRGLRNAWEQLLKGKLDPTELDNLITDLDGILVIIEAMR